MPDIIDANGLQVKTYNELFAKLTADLKAIYGNDINIASNSPDGQQMNIYVQAGVDLREIIQKINASFDINQAEGRTLDQRVGIIGINRIEGTYTFQPISVTTDKALNLVGLDGQATELEPTVADLYTVKDDEGNLFYLLASQTIVGAGTVSYSFRAAKIGKVETVPNTITTPETIISGVTSVNNPASALSVGINEETDITLRIRGKSSVAIGSEGYLDSIVSNIGDLDNVSNVFGYENDTSFTDADGTLRNTVWIIVEGGTDAEIAQVVYTKKPPGTGTRGTEVEIIVRPAGNDVPIRFDRPVSEDLYMRFTTSPTLTTTEKDALKADIVTNLFWTIGKDATSDIIYCYVKNYLGTGYVTSDVEVSKNGSSWAELAAVSSKQNKFINAVARITIT